MNTGAFCRRSNVWGVALTTHPDLAMNLKKEWAYTSTPSLRLHGLLQVTQLYYRGEKRIGRPVFISELTDCVFVKSSPRPGNNGGSMRIRWRVMSTIS
jgi:hypothetical protein